MIHMVKIIEMLIPKENTSTRPGSKRKPKSITIHETDNTNVRANALAHARLQVNGNRRQASWHYTVDDEPEVYQSVPDDEIAYHAGNKKGNKESISIEICVNRDGNYRQAVANTVQLVRYLIKKYPRISAVNVVQHHFWSGKNCPRYLRAGTKGINWTSFLQSVQSEQTDVKITNQELNHEQTSGHFTVGAKVRVKDAAKKYATGELIPDQYKGKTYTVQQRGSNRILLKEIYSWVWTKDLEGLKKDKPIASASTAGKSNYTGYSIVDYLQSIGVNSSYAHRKILANQHGISNYRGTAAQNIQLLERMRQQTSHQSNEATVSIVDYLKSKHMDSSFPNRRRLAEKYGIASYRGTAAQNTTLLKKLKG